MLDQAWFQDQLEDAIEVVAEKVKESRSSNKQLSPLLMAQQSMLERYGELLRVPRVDAMVLLERRIADLESKIKLLEAQGQLRSVGIGKTSLGGPS